MIALINQCACAVYNLFNINKLKITVPA